jgi:CRP/FNR family cyclic AMP-dependent transcriptional regulator
MPEVTFFWLLDTSIPFNRFILTQLNERLGQFVGAFEHDRLHQPEVRVAHTIANMLHPQLYPSREGRIEISKSLAISSVHRGKGSVRLCRCWRNPA